MTNGNDSAFTNETCVEIGDNVKHWKTPSLTKREYFAAMAMQGMLANLPEILTADIRDGFVGFGITSERSVQAADALIEALNK